jgi:hypothetical protein
MSEYKWVPVEPVKEQVDAMRATPLPPVRWDDHDAVAIKHARDMYVAAIAAAPPAPRPRAPECKDFCQYGKDVGMPEVSCRADHCEYAHAAPPAPPAGEPVAWYWEDQHGRRTWTRVKTRETSVPVVYAHPPADPQAQDDARRFRMLVRLDTEQAVWIVERVGTDGLREQLDTMMEREERAASETK